MKKTLLSLSMMIASSVLVFGQCSFDSQYSGMSGNFFPDSTTFLAEQSAEAGVDYSGVVSIFTISDTLVENPFVPGQTITAYIDAFKIESVTGQPAGFEYAEGGTTFDGTQWNNGGSGTSTTPVEGCLAITAAAADVAAAAPATGYTDYPINVLVDARISGTSPDLSSIIANGTWLSGLGAIGLGSLPVNDYVIRVHASTGVAELLNSTSFDVAQNFPNPAFGTVNISYTTPNSQSVELNVFNLLGEVMLSERVVSNSGTNKFMVDTDVLPSGMYVYTVTNGEETFTKKMTVK
jgi:hypothetical protein